MTVAAAEIEVRVIIEYMVSCCRFSGAAKASVAPPVAHPGPRLPLPCCTAVVDVRLISRNSQATKRSVGGGGRAAADAQAFPPTFSVPPRARAGLRAAATAILMRKIRRYVATRAAVDGCAILQLCNCQRERGASRHLKASPRVRITEGMIVSRLNESESEQLMNIGISVAYQPSESMPAAPKTPNERTDESGSARVLSGGTRDCSCGPRQQRSRKRIGTAQATRYLVAAALLHHVPDSVRAPSLLAHRLCRVNIKSTYFATRHVDFVSKRAIHFGAEHRRPVPRNSLHGRPVRAVAVNETWRKKYPSPHPNPKAAAACSRKAAIASPCAAARRSMR